MKINFKYYVKYHFKNFLITLLFCFIVSLIYWFIRGNQTSYMLSLVSSFSIGIITWALIDFGAYLFKSNSSSSSIHASNGFSHYPDGFNIIFLIVISAIIGYVSGAYFVNYWFNEKLFDIFDTKNIKISALFSLIVTFIISGFFYFRFKNKSLQLQMESAQKIATQTQLKLLQSQLEPHLLFNTLANLRVLIGNAPEQTLARKMLDHLISYLRTTLEASRVIDQYNLSTEFDRINDYLFLMSIRMGNRLTYELNLPSYLRNFQISPFLLQPLVENAIKHGLEPKIEGGHIIINASINQLNDSLNYLITKNSSNKISELILEVIDNGLGCENIDQLNNSSHFDDFKSNIKQNTTSDHLKSNFGLTQIHERLHVLYGEKASLKLIANKPTGIKAIVRIHC